MKFIRWIRKRFGFCPYCGARMKKGFGDSSVIFPTETKMRACPNKHYAYKDQLYYGGMVRHIYDNSGKELDIQMQ